MNERAGRRPAFLFAPSLFLPAACGFALWGVLVNYRHVPLGIVFLHCVFAALAGFFLGILAERRFGGSWRESAIPWLATFGYLAIALGVNNGSFFYLLSSVYYPYPRPDHPDLRVFLMSTAPIAFAALFSLMGGRACSYLAASSNQRRDVAQGMLGFGVGLAAANAVVAFSWVAALFVSLALLAVMIARSRTGVAASLALVAAAFGLHLRQPDLVYIGSLQEARLAAQIDSPYTRSHFYTFAGGNCVAVAGGFHVVTYNCLDRQRLPRGLVYFFRALVGDLPSYRALVVGRTLGMYPNILLAVNPNAALIQTAEYDPKQAAAVEQTFNPLTVPPGDRARIKYFAGDLSRFMLAQHDKYDVVFYNGIGLSQYQIPFAFSYQEQSLFTARVLEHLFADVLSPHGALVFDWGGRSLDEQDFIRAVLPKGTYSAAFWHVLTEPPFVGTPLTFVVASRDADVIAKVRDHLARASYFKDITDAPANNRPISWNRPFLRPDIVAFQLVCLAAVFLVFLAGLAVFRFRPMFLAPSSPFVQPWLAGAAAVGWFIDAAARQARQMIGYGYAWPAMALAFFGAAAVGMSLPLPLLRGRSGKFGLTVGAAACLAVSGADLTGPLALVPALFGGLLAGACWGMVLADDDRQIIPALFGGVATGFALNLALVFFVGFDGGSALAALFAVILCWTSRMDGRALVRA